MNEVSDEKRCKKCQVVKPLTEYYRASSGTRDGRRGDCIECNLAEKRARNARSPESNRDRVRRWREANPERVAEWAAQYRTRPDRRRVMRDLYFRRTYRLSADEVDTLIAAQEGRCAICHRVPKRQAQLHLDHDHRSGRIRGLVCSTCNKALGQFADDIARMLRAVVYLRNGGVRTMLDAAAG